MDAEKLKQVTSRIWGKPLTDGDIEILAGARPDLGDERWVTLMQDVRAAQETVRLPTPKVILESAPARQRVECPVCLGRGGVSVNCYVERTSRVRSCGFDERSYKTLPARTDCLVKLEILEALRAHGVKAKPVSYFVVCDYCGTDKHRGTIVDFFREGKPFYGYGRAAGFGAGGVGPERRQARVVIERALRWEAIRRAQSDPTVPQAVHDEASRARDELLRGDDETAPLEQFFREAKEGRIAGIDPETARAAKAADNVKEFLKEMGVRER